MGGVLAVTLKADKTADRDGARHPGGRPPHVPTRAQRDEVYRMASIDVSVEAIAAVTGIHADTLRKHYESELVEGWADGTAWLVDKLRQLADGGHKKARKLLAALSPRLAAIAALSARAASTAGPRG